MNNFHDNLTGQDLVAAYVSFRDPEDQSYLNGEEVKQIIRRCLIQLSVSEETHPPRQSVYYK